MEQVGNSILSQKITEDVGAEPVTLAEMKTYGNITYSDYDALLTTFITVSRQMLQNACSKVFGSATIDTYFTHSGLNPITLPWGWFGELASVQYRSCRQRTWTDIEVTDTRFEIEAGRFFGDRGHWKLTYTTEDIEVSETIKMAIKAQAMYLWENRGDSRKQGQICDQARVVIMQLVDGGLLL